MRRRTLLFSFASVLCLLVHTGCSGAARLSSLNSDFAVDVLSLEASAIRARLVADDRLLFKFERDYPSSGSAVFARGDKVIVGWKFDNLTGKGRTHVAIVDSLKARGYENSAEEITGNSISLWGARFELKKVEEKVFCLFRDGDCYAQLLGSVLSADVTPGALDRVRRGAIADLKAALSGTPAILCSKNGENHFEHFRMHRNVAEALFRMAPLLNLLPFEDERSEFWNEMLSAKNHLLNGYKGDFARTAYFHCKGVTEFMTGYLVIRGMDAMNRFDPSIQLESYMTRIFNEVKASDHARTIRTLASTPWSAHESEVYANMNAQYLGLHLIMSRLQGAELDPHLDGVIKNILRSQSRDNSRREASFLTQQDTCQQDQDAATELGGAVANRTYALQYGGWAHGVSLRTGRGDCRQSMGYHVLTFEPLLDFVVLTKGGAACPSRSFADSCTNVRKALGAALAYLTNRSVVQSGSFFGHAEGSTEDPAADRGTLAAVRIAFFALGEVDFSSLSASFDGSTRISRAELRDVMKPAIESLPSRKANLGFFVNAMMLPFRELTSDPIPL